VGFWVPQFRHNASNLNVAGSIPDEAFGFFNWPNPSSHILALGSTQRLTEISTRNILDGQLQPPHEADKFTAICEPIVNKMSEPRRLAALWSSTACYSDSSSEQSFGVHFQFHTLGPGVYSASNRNEYQKQKNVSVEESAAGA
jgi:hypothetical protein